MRNYTYMSEQEVAIEIDRYITWPGQACAYKFGEIKIREIRAHAENILGLLLANENVLNLKNILGLLKKDPMKTLALNHSNLLNQSKRAGKSVLLNSANHSAP